MGNPHLKSPAGTLAFGLELVLSVLSLVSILPRMLVERQRWEPTEISPKETQRPCCVRQRDCGFWPCCVCSVVLEWEGTALPESFHTWGVEGRQRGH